MILSFGLSKVAWRATASSTAPKLGARCPPVLATVETIFSLTSAATCSSCLAESSLSVSGNLILSSKVDIISGQGNNGGQRDAGKDFDRVMPQDFPQFFNSDLTIGIDIVNYLVEYLCLFAGRPTYAGGVVHNDQGKDQGNRKQR